MKQKETAAPRVRKGVWAQRGQAGRVFLLLSAALVLVAAHSASALEPTTPLANYARQSWVMENGLPQNTIHALAQTPDGFVWLGTEAGLVRFDGVGFQVFDHTSAPSQPGPSLPGNDIRSLLVASDGALWIGTGDGLVRWKSGDSAVFTIANGLPANGIRALKETSPGALWAWTDQGAAKFNGSRFEESGSGSLNVAMMAIVPDSRGELLATASAGTVEVVLRSVEGAHRQDPIARLTVGRELPGTRIQFLLADREASLWIGTNGGLVRWTGGKLESLPVTDPLARASVLALMEDREGNLWVGTETDGLDILRDQRFHTLGMRDGLTSNATTAVVEDSDGALWVGTAGGGLDVLGKNGHVRSYTVKDGLLSDVILSLAAGLHGEIWAGTPDGLNRISTGGIGAGSVARFTSADGLPDDFIRSLLVDADGSVWIGTRRGLAHWNGKAGVAGSPLQMESYTQANGLGSDLVGAMARDAVGDLWVATRAGLSRLHAGSIANFTTADGLASNVVTSLLPRADGTLLIGTQDHGWAVWDKHGFFRSGGERSNATTIHAILDDGAGRLWFATGNGIARCELKVAATPECAHWVEFGAADGLRSREMASNSHPSAWRSRDGHLWFASPDGLVEVDPAHFSLNAIAPPVALERFVVDDVDQPLRSAESGLRVASGHVHFEFDYVGLSFTAPQKVRYRYMLDGFDHGWTEAGARRSAYYTNIPPGKYTFRVQAANNDGLWSTAGAALAFELRPRFYQTGWFYVLLLVAAAALVLLVLRQRLRRAESEFRAVLGERSRIAREIHDTLAQGYVGISAQLEVLGELLRKGKKEESVAQLDLTRAHVREGLAEARQSIWALRTQDSSENTLPVKMRRIAEAAGGAGLKAEFSIFGAYRPLPPGTEQELLRVAQEAIHNVKKHAGARQLFVQLEYRPGTITLEVRDDGRGGAAEKKAGSAQGHFGLTGMRERAEAIGGTLEVSSQAGEGTAVRLSAPAPRVGREQTGEPN
jgi:signal transduction histidine kinase/ligand-binding sensor domain-containing protein